MRYLYLLKLLRAWPDLGLITDHPLKLWWEALRNKPHLPIRLNGQTIALPIWLPNVYGLLRLRKAGWNPTLVDQKTLAWELAPGRFFHTRLTEGMDLMTLYEIFVRKDYGEAFAGKTVLDVGAYNGDSAVYFALQGAQRVIALEPYPPNYELAQANARRMQLENVITLLPAALGIAEGEATFHVSSIEPDANTLQPTDLTKKLIPFDKQLRVQVYSLKALLAQMGLYEVDYVKLDCEGCEFALFEVTPPEVLRQVRFWHIEYHSNPRPLIARLATLGYQTQKVFDRWGLGYLIAERR